MLCAWLLQQAVRYGHYVSFHSDILILTKETCPCFTVSNSPPPNLFDFVRQLLLFSLLCCVLTLSLKPAHAQPPGSGGPGSGGSGSGGSGLPGSGGPGSGGGATGGPYWHINITSEGNVQSTGPTGSQTAAWNSDGESAASFIMLQGGQGGTITTTGHYYVMLRWLNSDGTTPSMTGYGSPPKNVLVDTISTMKWGGPFTVSSGSADNGLGSSQIIINDNPMQVGFDSGEQYEVYDGSQGIITYHIDVNATVTGTVLDSSASNLSVNVSRNINVSCNSIILGLQGTTPDPNKNNIDSILISQHCSAGVFTQTPQASFSNFQWTVDGDTFDSFFISGDQTSGHVVYCNPAIWSSSGPGWCWCDTGGAGAQNGDGTVSVSCDVFANSKKIKNITDSRPVTLWAPYSKFDAIPAAPISTIYNKGDDGTGPQSGVTAQGTDGDSGMSFEGYCGTQDLFHTNDTDPKKAWGRWVFAQILTLNRNQVASYSYNYNLTINNALDGSFPYNTDFAANNNSDSSIHGSDSPGPAVDSPLSGFISQVTSFNITDTYKIYMMYQAPGSSQWVPIRSVTWHWNTAGSRPSGSSAPFVPDPPLGGVTSDGTHSDSTFPWWNNKYQGHN